LHVTVEDVLGDGDRVAVRWTARGTHESEWLGIPRPAGTSCSAVWTSTDSEQGKICEWWLNDDFAYLAEQLTGDSRRGV
jgi:predicted ester cyclase